VELTLIDLLELLFSMELILILKEDPKLDMFPSSPNFDNTFQLPISNIISLLLLNAFILTELDLVLELLYRMLGLITSGFSSTTTTVD